MALLILNGLRSCRFLFFCRLCFASWRFRLKFFPHYRCILCHSLQLLSGHSFADFYFVLLLYLLVQKLFDFLGVSRWLIQRRYLHRWIFRLSMLWDFVELFFLPFLVFFLMRPDFWEIEFVEFLPLLFGFLFALIDEFEGNLFIGFLHLFIEAFLPFDFVKYFLGLLFLSQEEFMILSHLLEALLDRFLLFLQLQQSGCFWELPFGWELDL